MRMMGNISRFRIITTNYAIMSLIIIWVLLIKLLCIIFIIYLIFLFILVNFFLHFLFVIHTIFLWLLIRNIRCLNVFSHLIISLHSFFFSLWRYLVQGINFSWRWFSEYIVNLFLLQLFLSRVVLKDWESLIIDIWMTNSWRLIILSCFHYCLIITYKLA